MSHGEVKAVRIAIGIGGDADYAMLEKIIGHSEIAPLRANNAETLTQYIVGPLQQRYKRHRLLIFSPIFSEPFQMRLDLRPFFPIFLYPHHLLIKVAHLQMSGK